MSIDCSNSAPNSKLMRNSSHGGALHLFFSASWMTHHQCTLHSFHQRCSMNVLIRVSKTLILSSVHPSQRTFIPVVESPRGEPITSAIRYTCFMSRTLTCDAYIYNSSSNQLYMHNIVHAYSGAAHHTACTCRLPPHCRRNTMCDGGRRTHCVRSRVRVCVGALEICTSICSRHYTAIHQHYQHARFTNHQHWLVTQLKYYLHENRIQGRYNTISKIIHTPEKQDKFLFISLAPFSVAISLFLCSGLRQSALSNVCMLLRLWRIYIILDILVPLKVYLYLYILYMHYYIGRAPRLSSVRLLIHVESPLSFHAHRLSSFYPVHSHSISHTIPSISDYFDMSAWWIILYWKWAEFDCPRRRLSLSVISNLLSFCSFDRCQRRWTGETVSSWMQLGQTISRISSDNRKTKQNAFRTELTVDRYHEMMWPLLWRGGLMISFAVHEIIIYMQYFSTQRKKIDNTMYRVSIINLVHHRQMK